MTRPVDIAADVRYTCHTAEGMTIGCTIYNLRNGAAIIFCMGVGVQHFFKQRRHVYQVGGKTQVLLRELVFHHQRGLRHSAKQWMKRFEWLKIYGTILYLYQY